MCILDIISANAGVPAIKPKLKVQCNSCEGFCYSPSKIRIFNWCDEYIHAKGYKDNLGCIQYCDKCIPGFHVTNYELYDDHSIY